MEVETTSIVNEEGIVMIPLGTGTAAAPLNDEVAVIVIASPSVSVK
jgi:hypothetical protein